MKSLGQIAFDAYRDAASREAVTDSDATRMQWSELGPHARETWEQLATVLAREFVGPIRICAIHIGSAKIALDLLPPSRERSCVLTKLDEAEMWLERAERQR